MSKNIGLIPLYDRIIIKMEKIGTKTDSGIIIPENSKKEKQKQGIVVAVGKGKRSDSGDILQMSVKVGNKIIFPHHSSEEIELDGEKYLILNEDSVLAIIK